jgi:phosphoserine phosphatase RsbU/P
MKAGDLLVFFTDGISEPEDEYGEMFGEDRLGDLVVKNNHLPDDQIAQLIIKAARDWSNTDYLQDDMTLLLLRRV